MVIPIPAGAYLVTVAIYVVVMVLAVGERARSFKAISPGMLPPLGIIFGLLVGFTAACTCTGRAANGSAAMSSPSVEVASGPNRLTPALPN